jgi:hypothetical protein
LQLTLIAHFCSYGALVSCHYSQLGSLCITIDPRWAVGGKFPSGGYRKIDQSVGSMIDWVFPSIVMSSFFVELTRTSTMSR